MKAQSKKPLILFFSRDYQSQFFPELVSDVYDSIYVTLNKKEKQRVTERGGQVVACLEEEYDLLPEADITFPYLEYSMGSDRFLRGYTHQGRLSIIKKCVSFWSAIFDKYKPDCIVHEVVAIEVSEIMLLEARKRKIKYLAFGAFSVGRSFYFYETPFHSSMPDRIKGMKPSAQNITDAKNYIDKLKHGDVDNPFIKNLKGNKDVRRLFRLCYGLLAHIYYRLTIKGKVIRQLCYENNTSYFKSEILSYFRYIFKGGGYDNIGAVDKSLPQFFYPMHFEPEATLFYQSTYYENQYALIENLLKCLAENQLLLVKEHPAQPGFLMQRKFKELKRRFPNIMYIKADVSSKEMINRSKAVITLVSTAGFEALAIGKPVILLGKIYYDSFEGVNYCNTFEQVYDLVRGYKPFNTSDNFQDFLSRLIAMQYTGNPWINPHLYTDENISSIRRAIEQQVS
jgi:hypothetical protein